MLGRFIIVGSGRDTSDRTTLGLRRSVITQCRHGHVDDSVPEDDSLSGIGTSTASVVVASPGCVASAKSPSNAMLGADQRLRLHLHTVGVAVDGAGHCQA